MSIKHLEASFDFEGSVTVESINSTHGTNVCRVTLNGVPNSSGCEDKAVADLFSIEALVNASDRDEVLNAFSVEDIVEYLEDLEEEQITFVRDRMQDTLMEEV